MWASIGACVSVSRAVFVTNLPMLLSVDAAGSFSIVVCRTRVVASIFRSLAATAA